MDVHPTLRKLDAESFRILFLWIHAGEGRSMTRAELELLTERSPYFLKTTLKVLAANGLAVYSGLAEHSACQLTLNAYNLFVVAGQPSDPTAPIPQPTAGQARLQPTGIAADQPTDHEVVVLGRDGTPVQKKNFFAKNFFSTEEEDSLINLNTESSSSESSGPGKKNFFPSDLAERVTALKTHGRFFSRRVIDELALLEHCTPEYIRAMACGFYHGEQRGDREGGMLRRRMLDHASPPVRLCRECLEPEPDEPEQAPDEISLEAREIVARWLERGEVAGDDHYEFQEWVGHLGFKGDNVWEGRQNWFFGFGAYTSPYSMSYGRRYLADRLSAYFTETRRKPVQVHF